MRLGLIQLRRSARRTTALVLAFGILTALVLFVSALSATLDRSLSGAVATMEADLVVLTTASRGVPQASRITSEQLDRLSTVSGVARSAPVGELRVTAVVHDREVAASLFGASPSGPGRPATLLEGRRPTGPGEVVIDEIERRNGLAVGDQVRIVGADVELTIVGIARGARFGGILTLHATFDDWRSTFAQRFPDATELRPTMVAVVVTAAEGETSAVMDRINREVDGVTARTPEQAASELPGLAGIRDSFRMITIVAVGAALLLVAAFWSLVASQQARDVAVLSAIGVRRSRLVHAMLTQVGVVAALGTMTGAVAVWALGEAAPPTFPLAVHPATVGLVVLLLVGGALIAALPALTSVTRVDPVRAIAAADR